MAYETTDEMIERLHRYWEVGTTGPVFRWFAWHPVWTQDRGWRWLRPVWKWRVVPPRVEFKRAYWVASVSEPHSAAQTSPD